MVAFSELASIFEPRPDPEGPDNPDDGNVEFEVVGRKSRKDTMRFLRSFFRVSFGEPGQERELFSLDSPETTDLR